MLYYFRDPIYNIKKYLGMPSTIFLICFAMCFLVFKVSYMYDVVFDVCNMYLSLFFIVGQAKKKVQSFSKRNMKSLVTLKNLRAYSLPSKISIKKALIRLYLSFIGTLVMSLLVLDQIR